MSISNPGFDEAEQEILSKLVPEGEEPGSEPVGQAPEDPLEPTTAAVTPEPTQAPTPAATPAPSPEPAPAPTSTQPPAVPPGNERAALRASRRNEARALRKVDELTQALEDAKSGKSPEGDTVTDEELAELEENFPAQAKAVREVRALKAQVEAMRPQPAASTEFEAAIYAPEVQAVIDEVPDLLAWQHDPQGAPKFARAVEYDKALLLDPDWKDKQPVERFTEAARRVKAVLTPAAPAAPAAPRLDPAAVIANAPLHSAQGISDFGGGAPPNQTRPNYAALSDEAIISSLRPED